MLWVGISDVGGHLDLWKAGGRTASMMWASTAGGGRAGEA